MKHKQQKHIYKTKYAVTVKNSSNSVLREHKPTLFINKHLMCESRIDPNTVCLRNALVLIAIATWQVNISHTGGIR